MTIRNYFYGLIKLSSNMSELDVRNEVVRLIKLKEIPAHLLHRPRLIHFIL